MLQEMLILDKSSLPTFEILHILEFKTLIVVESFLSSSGKGRKAFILHS